MTRGFLAERPSDTEWHRVAEKYVGVQGDAAEQSGGRRASEGHRVARRALGSE